jgi:hypothetical protein
VYLLWGEYTLVLGKDQLHLLIAKTFDVNCTQSSFTVSDIFFFFGVSIKKYIRKTVINERK